MAFIFGMHRMPSLGRVVGSKTIRHTSAKLLRPLVLPQSLAALSTTAQEQTTRRNWVGLGIGVGVAAAGVAGLTFNTVNAEDAKLRTTPSTAKPGHGPFGGLAVEIPQVPERLDLPTISLSDFRKPRDEAVWVALDGGVYDVTPFLDAHPGGAGRIMMVNGSDLGEFWKIYELHNRPHIRDLLEDYRIGSLTDADMLKVREQTNFWDVYDNDPVRTRFVAGDLRTTSRVPWNAEPGRLSMLTESFFTPNDIFFVRNHNAVPEVDVSDWTLDIEANPACGITKDISFTYEQLKNDFPRVEVVSALQCAGNRQEDYVTEDRPLYVAPHWRNGAIGNAKWAGVRIRDVLRAAGMDVDAISLGQVNPGAKIVNFIAEDHDETGVPYAGVIPIEKALDPFGDAILAYEMNGEVLPKDHGYPIRCIAPGHAGCRNVKWVSQIIVSSKPSELDSGSRLDRHYSPDVSWDAHRDHTSCDRCEMEAINMRGEVRMETGPVIQTGPVTSIICVPENKARLSGRSVEDIEVKGIAWVGGGRGICRVEVSIDGGENFEPADLCINPSQCSQKPTPEMGMGRNYAWTQYSRRVKLPPAIKQRLKNGEKVSLEVVCKAVDGDMNQQPRRMRDNWNVLGIAVNHWHRIQVTLDPALAKGMTPDPPKAPGPGQTVDSAGNSWEAQQ
eukprot:m.99943 g.99943  ORF g.99943 m.99943 type:complete len:670 (-) comp27206_c0_seq1:115-2124(-)